LPPVILAFFSSLPSPFFRNFFFANELFPETAVVELSLLLEVSFVPSLDFNGDSLLSSFLFGCDAGILLVPSGASFSLLSSSAGHDILKTNCFLFL
jgi:hypothetical protein